MAEARFPPKWRRISGLVGVALPGKVATVVHQPGADIVVLVVGVVADERGKGPLTLWDVEVGRQVYPIAHGDEEIFLQTDALG
jgi:hypothetical protein